MTVQVVSSLPTTPPAEQLLWPCNLPVWELWSRLQTQWRITESGIAIGLDYAAVVAMMSLYDLHDTVTMDKIRALEAVMLAEWHRQRQRHSSAPSPAPAPAHAAPHRSAHHGPPARFGAGSSRRY